MSEAATDSVALVSYNQPAAILREPSELFAPSRAQILATIKAALLGAEELEIDDAAWLRNEVSALLKRLPLEPTT